MAVRVAINGFGRVGRYLVRAALNNAEMDIVAINSRADAKTLAHLLKYDSVHGKISCSVETAGRDIIVADKKITVTAVTGDICTLPWRELGVDIVLESTGKFRKKDQLVGHLEAGAKKVIIAAPGKAIDGTFVMGVNEETYDNGKHNIVSNASCTTNCLAPVAKVLNDSFGIEKGLMTTIHAYTMDQRLLDGSHKDLRRARAAAMSIIPTSTGAASAVAEVIPSLKGKLDGIALRVPTPNVSLVDFSAQLTKSATVVAINEAMLAASQGALKGILAYSDEELVSVDFTSSHYSSIFDAPLTNVLGDNFVKVFSWYDNESGYACRMVDLAIYMGKRL
ncbi:MAG: type I glyceraldehyde-3-phosphate dehydrogenase [Deltaproteobacteria bacterium]|nr:type I glyceraldehyde-3-phosphate dehydrogenase [Deltaproteobacteria bacterium]